ncbi:hypothetical protein SVAN01_10852 [Stagonosporopsis vannaccii]|nr:hypothetical protein SVAN01_10852 [Stagonosporopsis vannaccii]
MAVYTVPYDQALYRRSFPDCNVDHSDRPTAGDFPALHTKNSIKVGNYAALGDNAEKRCCFLRLTARETTFHRFLELSKEVRESVWNHTIRDEPFCGPRA